METIVIKIGGVASDNLTPAFFQQIKTWQEQHKKIVIVHGGGHYINTMMEKLSLTVEIKDGLRVTTPEVLEVTKMVLIGQVQPMITARFQANGLTSVGLNASCGHMMRGTFLDQEKLGAVGQLEDVNADVIELLSDKKHIPIVAPLAMTAEGDWLNVNADHVAAQVAASLAADKLYLLTDVPGVKAAGEWQTHLSHQQIEELLSTKEIHGGMIPKIKSAEKALASGVKQVHITNTIQQTGTILAQEVVA